LKSTRFPSTSTTSAVAHTSWPIGGAAKWRHPAAARRRRGGTAKPQLLTHRTLLGHKLQLNVRAPSLIIQITDIMWIFGAPGTIRTSDPQIRSLMLKKPTTGVPNRYQKSHMALARSPEPGDESRRNHIVSAIEDRNELCTDCVIRNGYSRHRCPTVSTLVRTAHPGARPFIGHSLDTDRDSLTSQGLRP
jgi:hypothetical protein